jgi:hypothetical protein
MKSRPEPVIGKTYTYDEVGHFYDHDASELDWVLYKGRYIVALCLRSDLNRVFTDTAFQVYVGLDSPSKAWGDTLANDTARVPIFMNAMTDGKYTYIGIYEVSGDTTSESDCREAERIRPHHPGVSRIVGLRQIPTRSFPPWPI